MQLEVEQKFRLDDPNVALARLATAGVTWSESERQVDTYFAHPSRDFRQTDEAFRLRRIGEQNFFTYKGPKIDAMTKTRRELEVPLVAGDKVALQYAQLVEALGFCVGGVVAKTRRHGQLTQDGWTIDVMWDEVDRLGTFLELEVVASAEQLAAARDAVLALATRLELTTAERRSYLELLQDSTL